jgi:hypothetical protein
MRDQVSFPSRSDITLINATRCEGVIAIADTSLLRRVAEAFDLAGIANAVGWPALGFLGEESALSLSKGRESEMPARRCRQALKGVQQICIAKRSDMKYSAASCFRLGQ